MPSTLVTCPESAHLERIEVIPSPLGLLVQRCTAFEDGCSCPRTCAARLDHKLGREGVFVGSLILARSCLREK